MATLISYIQYCTGCPIARKKSIPIREEEIILLVSDMIVYEQNPKESIKCY